MARGLFILNFYNLHQRRPTIITAIFVHFFRFIILGPITPRFPVNPHCCLVSYTRIWRPLVRKCRFGLGGELYLHEGLQLEWRTACRAQNTKSHFSTMLRAQVCHRNVTNKIQITGMCANKSESPSRHRRRRKTTTTIVVSRNVIEMNVQQPS